MFGCEDNILNTIDSNGTTNFGFELPNSGNVIFIITDRYNSEVKTFDLGELNAGLHTLSWDGKNNNGNNVNEGVYFYKIFVDNQLMAAKEMYLFIPDAL